MNNEISITPFLDAIVSKKTEHLFNTIDNVSKEFDNLFSDYDLSRYNITYEISNNIVYTKDNSEYELRAILENTFEEFLQNNKNKHLVIYQPVYLNTIYKTEKYQVQVNPKPYIMSINGFKIGQFKYLAFDKKPDLMMENVLKYHPNLLKDLDPKILNMLFYHYADFKDLELEEDFKETIKSNDNPQIPDSFKETANFDLTNRRVHRRIMNISEPIEPLDIICADVDIPEKERSSYLERISETGEWI